MRAEVHRVADLMEQGAEHPLHRRFRWRSEAGGGAASAPLEAARQRPD